MMVIFLVLPCSTPHVSLVSVVSTAETLMMGTSNAIFFASLFFPTRRRKKKTFFLLFGLCNDKIVLSHNRTAPSETEESFFSPVVPVETRTHHHFFTSARVPLVCHLFFPLCCSIFKTMFLLHPLVVVAAAFVLPLAHGWAVTRPTMLRSCSSYRISSLTSHHQHPTKTMEQLGAATERSRSSGAPEHSHILILPGFGTETSDYTCHGSLAPNLVRRGWDESRVHVLPVQRLDWINTIVLGALDSDFWHGAASPARPAYFWYLQRVAKEIKRIDQHVKHEYGEQAKAKFVIVGHSAGGWLARAAVGYGIEMCLIDIENLLGIVTLGTPHLPSPIGAIDVTGGALRATNNRFPGAYFSDKLFYVTAASNAVTAKFSFEGEFRASQSLSSSLSSMTSQQSCTTSGGVPESLKKLAYWSYLQVSGSGGEGGAAGDGIVGDGIVPMNFAHLEGAIQINLEKVFHTAGLSSTSSSWYGSDNILDLWFGSVMKILEQLA